MWRHPYRGFSTWNAFWILFSPGYEMPRPFHGVNTGSNPVADATNPKGQHDTAVLVHAPFGAEPNTIDQPVPHRGGSLFWWRGKKAVNCYCSKGVKFG